ncbi:hypothetical protein ASZ90_017909 [hydrocarbon metagenome]|uniref:Uncharacterized protein n=1 Tax=hydrocarbon metagenome TaxID=938273 RepID=A0A0W8E804_9ZZZZ
MDHVAMDNRPKHHVQREKGLLLIEHDRAFCDNMATKTILL